MRIVNEFFAELESALGKEIATKARGELATEAAKIAVKAATRAKLTPEQIAKLVRAGKVFFEP